MDGPPRTEQPGNRPFGAHGIFGICQRFRALSGVGEVRRVEVVGRSKQKTPAAKASVCIALGWLGFCRLCIQTQPQHRQLGFARPDGFSNLDQKIASDEAAPDDKDRSTCQRDAKRALEFMRGMDQREDWPEYPGINVDRQQSPLADPRVEPLPNDGMRRAATWTRGTSISKPAAIPRRLPDRLPGNRGEA